MMASAAVVLHWYGRIEAGIVCQSAAPVGFGLLHFFISLFTGAVWGQTHLGHLVGSGTHGLTIAWLILLFLYGGVNRS